MTSSEEPIPTISFKGIRADGRHQDISALRQVASEILSACVTHGFFYLADIEQFIGSNAKVVDAAWDAASTLFLDDSAEAHEQRMASRDREGHTGYTAVGEEKLDQKDPASKRGDAKESFYIASARREQKQKLPAILAPYQEPLAQFYDACRDVSRAILRAFGIGLDLGEDFFAAKHGKEQHDRLRLIHYPPAPLHDVDNPSLIRAGSHSDYGSITLLFQRDVSGLQVLTNDEWHDVPPKEDCIVVNVGDALEFWTAGLLRSTQHRVVMPRTESETCSRFSIAFFSQPDEDSELRPLDKDKMQQSLASQHPSSSSQAPQHSLVRADYDDVLRRKGISPDIESLTGGQHLKARLAASYA